MRQRLTETSAGQGQPLDVHGRRLIDCYDQLAGILRNRLGQNHAHFLSQPVERSGSITWFTPLAGEVSSEDALSPEERQRLKDRASQILGDIEGLASDMSREGATGPMLAQMLRAATQRAPASLLFSVGGKPVITLWGHHSGVTSSDAAARAVATPAVNASTAPVMASAARSDSAVANHAVPAGGQARGDSIGARRDPRTWIVSALVALSLIVFLVWGVKSCSVPRAVPDAPADLKAQIAEVEARNKALETEIAQRKSNPPRVKCVPEPIPAAPKAAREPAAMRAAANEALATAREMTAPWLR